MNLSQIIEKAWSNPQTPDPEAVDAVETILDQLDSGQLRIAEKNRKRMDCPSMAETSHSSLFQME